MAVRSGADRGNAKEGQMGNGIFEGEEGRKERLRFYNEALRDQWDKYLQIPNQMILLSGGTAVLFLENLPLDWRNRPGTGMVWVSICLSGFSLLFSLTWRLFSQALMEYETLAPEVELARYCEDAKIDRVRIPFNRPAFLRFWRRGYDIVPGISCCLLVASWILIALFWPK